MKTRSGRGCAPKLSPEMARYAKIFKKLREPIPFEWLDLVEKFLDLKTWVEFNRLCDDLLPVPHCRPDFRLNLAALENATESQQRDFAEMIDNALCLLGAALPKKIVAAEFDLAIAEGRV